MSAARALILALALAASPALADEVRPGIGIDAHGQAVVDPTKNVLDLVTAAIARQDDLRHSLQESVDARMKLIAELSALRSQHDRELLDANTSRLESEAKLRADFDKLIRAARRVTWIMQFQS